MKKTKFEILIFICMILLGLGCFLIATKNNQYNFFEDILSRYPEENIAGTLMVDLTHDGNDELLVISLGNHIGNICYNRWQSYCNI